MKALTNMFQRWRTPVAWTNTTNEAVRHYLDQKRFVHRMTTRSNVDSLTEPEIEEHYRALDSIIAELKGVPVYLRSTYLPSMPDLTFSEKKVFQIGENYL